MKRIKKLFEKPGLVIGKTFYFVDRADCCGCYRHDSLKNCPDYDNPDACPLKIVAVRIDSVGYYRVGRRLYCSINDRYEFEMARLGLELYERRYDAWLHMMALEDMGL